MNEPAVPDALLPPSADAIIEAPSGPILVIRRCSPDLIERLTVDSGFGHILRPRTAKTTLRRIAARLSGNVTLAVAPGGVIVGYVLVARPEPTRWQQRVMHERWEQCQAIHELGSLEVSKNFRRLGIADKLMETALAGDAYDGAIVIAETIRWHWDLSTSGGDAFLYRERLLALMKRYGFDEYVTDEADVRSDPANALVARIGGAATPEHVQHFHALRLVSRRLPHPVADAAEPPSVVHTAASGASIARVLVGDYMTADPLTVAPEDTLHAAWRIMLDRKVRHLPVLLDGKLVGVLTDRDIKEAMPSSDVVADPAEALSFLAMVRVQERMQHQVLAAAPTTAIAVAAGLLLQHRIGCLPVVDDGHVVGILTQTDLLRALVEVLADQEAPGDPECLE